MKTFNPFEQKIATFLGRYPGLKDRAKRIYNHLNYALHRSGPKVDLYPGLHLEKASYQGHSSFFGYYDKPSLRGEKQIYHSLPKDFRNARPTSQIQIVCDHKVVSTTRSWNWQQGSMLSWLDDQRIIHNDWNGENYISKIVHLSSGESQTLPQPVYKVAHQGEWALSLNFKRLAQDRPDYGYFNHDIKEPLPALENDGLFRLEFKTGKWELLISLAELSGFKPRPYMEGARHKINHIDLSPNNEKVIFHHRWTDIHQKRFTRLFVYDLHSRELKLLLDEDLVSHCCWWGSDKVVCYGRKSPFGTGYFVIDVTSGNVTPLKSPRLVADGHPSVRPQGDWMVTDTYPDRARHASLILLHLKTHKEILLGRFHSPLQYFGERRCDLHPRWSDCGTKISFDSVHEGARYLCTLDVEEIL